MACLQYLAIGEAPEEVRNVFRQRSRWTKGHYQVRYKARAHLLALHQAPASCRQLGHPALCDRDQCTCGQVFRD